MISIVMCDVHNYKEDAFSHLLGKYMYTYLMSFVFVF